jgi:hypothetical protein
MLVPEEGAVPVIIADRGAIDEQTAPQLSFTSDQVDNVDSSAEPDATEKEKQTKERRARARRRAMERRAKLRTTGFVFMVVAAFGALMISMVELVRFSNRTALTGTVTYEGKPIANGYITFTPVDGKGQAASARIVNGKYELARLSIGDNVVLITAVADMQFSKARPDPNQLEGATSSAQSDLVSPDAIGNNTTVTIEKGKHVLNFDLSAPPPPKESKKGEKKERSAPGK